MSAAGIERGAQFAPARERFESLVGFLTGSRAAEMSHGELEEWLGADGRELLRQLYQDHLDVRAQREPRLPEVTGSDGVVRSRAEARHRRTVHTVFGEVVVDRIAYRQPGHANLHPADAILNLPEETYSHGLRRLAAVEAARGSYDETVEALERATGQHVGKRQAEQLALRAASDFDDFYADRRPPRSDTQDVLVISADGKGVVMRPEGLREATAKKAAEASTKLTTRLSKGEKANRKRLAEVGAVYDAAPVPRTPADILTLPNGAPEPTRAPAPVARNKWLTASIVQDAASVVSQVFDEAERRDPDHQRTVIALVDGNNHQIRRIKAEAKTRNLTVHTVIDFIHVLEYLWSAVWCFFKEGDPHAERWVHQKALAVLEGKASIVAASIRRKATRRGLTGSERANADTCAHYLIRKRHFLNYPLALANGWPIATGVIEGACRHLVKDRMDLTGARWGLDGAEAVLKLRAIRSNDDFQDYWRYHLAQERRRIHQARYADQAIPGAA